MQHSTVVIHRWQRKISDREPVMEKWCQKSPDRVGKDETLPA
jgi:hypothetical protein